MMYALLIWTVVAAGNSGTGHKDWRLLAEFHNFGQGESTIAPQKKCEDAASQLGLNSKLYRCIRVK